MTVETIFPQATSDALRHYIFQQQNPEVTLEGK